MHCLSRGGCYLVNSYCDLQEENQWKKESYQACWLSVVLETRLQYKVTLSEIDNVRRESYKQQQVTHFMVQRSPSQMLWLGSNSRGMTQHQQPFFKTSRDREQTEQKPVTLGKEDKREVTGVTHDISKPARVNFRASSLMSSPRDTSQRVQRRE